MSFIKSLIVYSSNNIEQELDSLGHIVITHCDDTNRLITNSTLINLITELLWITNYGVTYIYEILNATEQSIFYLGLSNKADYLYSIETKQELTKIVNETKLLINLHESYCNVVDVLQTNSHALYDVKPTKKSKNSYAKQLSNEIDEFVSQQVNMIFLSERTFNSALQLFKSKYQTYPIV